jgi:hypothetical protein
MRLRPTLLVFCVVCAVVGCSPVAGWWPLLLLAVSLLASACIEVVTPARDSGASHPQPDSGRWEPCCDDGVISSCFCPANAVCNYLPFVECGEGTCDIGFMPDAEVCGAPDGGQPDGGMGDAGRDGGRGDGGPDGSVIPDAASWGPCCQNGVITTCFCPANWICNYGLFTNCGDGTCADGPFSAEAGVCAADAGPDGAVPDGGTYNDAGSWDTCCQNGVIATCFCPANVACNYGWFTNCGGSACVDGIFPQDARVCLGDAGQDAQ